MTIIPATEEHVPAVAAMLEDFFAFHAGLQPTFYRAAEECGGYPRAAIESDESTLFIALEGEEAIGFINLLEDLTPPYEVFVPYRHATVVDLYVKPAHRERGVATALLARADDWARERGLSYLELNVLAENTGGVHFYMDSGFATTSHTLRRFVADGKEHPSE